MAQPGDAPSRAPEDYWWLHALTTPPVRTANRRRLAQAGLTPETADRGVRMVTRSLGEDGPLSRDDLRSRLGVARIPTAGQARALILILASLDGLIVRGPVIGGAHCYVLVADWIGTSPVTDRDVALAELARRYLAGHGPSSERDLAAWAGIGLGEARGGRRALGGALTELPGGLVDLEGLTAPGRLPPPRLLGAFDPLLHGWRDRSQILPGNRTVITNNGIFRPFLLAGGRALATWGLAAGVLRLEPFEPLTDDLQAAARLEAADGGHFLGLGPLAVEGAGAPAA